MKREWTDEQKQAIDFSGKSAIVSAAAGSGKTAVLVERVMRIISDGVTRVPADKIVLVTFTRKAAAEMKERLERALLTEITTSGNPWLEEQLMRLEDTQITTINAFCYSLLRENAGFAGLEPGFTVAEGGELELIAKAAINDTLEEFYNGDEHEITKTLSFFQGTGDFELRRAIREMYLFTRTLPNPDEWITEQEQLYSNSTDYYNKLIPFYESLFQEKVGQAIALIDESLSIAAQTKTTEFLSTERDYFTNFDNFTPTAEYPRKSIHKDEDDAVKEIVSENRKKTDSIKKELVLISGLISTFKEAVERLQPIITTVIRLFRVYESNFTKRKRAARVIDFSDTEHMCMQLLKNNTIAVERIRRDYDYIIVDEFQDSNFLQYELFRLLDGGRNRLFFVGDIKQSIYKFRGAQPEVFDHVSTSGEYQTLYLSKNFRSSDEVIESVNDIFENIMPDYDENVRLKPGRGISDEAYKTEVVLLDENAYPELDSVHAEAYYTALRIKEMVQSKRYSYGDFAVLTSVGEKNFKVYRKTFNELNVPCICDGEGDYLKAEEVGLALDLLTIINNPYNDLSLLNILMSPLYGFTAEELAIIRTNQRKTPLYTAIKANKSEKAVSFISTISHLRRMADICDITELIGIINNNGGFLPLIADKNKYANLRLLLFYAESFAKRSTDASLNAFLTYIKDLKNIGADIKQASVNMGVTDCVRLMTIHSAKGLEFPVCFVGRINQEFNFRGVPKPPLIKFEKTAGISAYCFDEASLCRFKTLHWDYTERLNRIDTISEEKRKLYVAATRAEYKLIFTGYAKSGGIKDNSYAQLIDNAQCTMHNPQLINAVGGDAHITPQIDISGEAETIAKNISLEYPRSVLTDIPRKFTATQAGIKRESHYDEADEPSVFPRNPSFYGEKRLTGKKRGDAYHKAMELINFTSGGYTEQLCDMEIYFTPTEYKAISPKHIESFFASDLGKRAVKSEKIEKEYKLYTEIELRDLGVDVAFAEEKPFVQGIADMFFYENGEIVLVDYKTNRNTSAEKLVNEYSGQLSIYKKAIEEMTGVRVKECWVYAFELGEHGAIRI
ncbi:MAG: UvrD-helicase domain-containing protein [Oscillospiraceae bacterium]|nr:UvrD-helicase domain-containing protein [Oscillospiraceae bacterium]